jgi:phage baseplate assembly protein W
MTVADIIGSGIAFPLRVDRRGSIALSHDDDDVQEAISLILSTAPGDRPMRPEFGCGVHDHIFGGVDAHTLGRLEYEIRVALDRWEPRIDVLEIDFDLSETGSGRLLIQIGYLLRATNDIRNLVYPFYLIPAEEPE